MKYMKRLEYLSLRSVKGPKRANTGCAIFKRRCIHEQQLEGKQRSKVVCERDTICQQKMNEKGHFSVKNGK